MGYHINKNGDIAICKAIKGKCPFDRLTMHFESKEEAEDYNDFYQRTSLMLEGIDKKYGIGVDVPPEKASNDYFRERGALVDRMLSDVHLQRFETIKLYATERRNGTYKWNLERRKEHDKILSEMIEKYSNVPTDGKIIFSGGLSGAGKTSTLAKHIDLNQYAQVNSDDFKEILAEKGMIPNIKGLSPLECSTLVHEESSYLADRFLSIMMKHRKNIIFDSTLKTTSTLEKKLAMADRIRQNNPIGDAYTGDNVSVVFVDIDIDTTKQRTLSRYKNGHTRWLNAEKDNTKEFGGRYIPNTVIENCRPLDVKKSSRNRETVETIMHNKEKYPFKFAIFDNNGTSPVCLHSDIPSIVPET